MIAQMRLKPGGGGEGTFCITLTDRIQNDETNSIITLHVSPDKSPRGGGGGGGGATPNCPLAQICPCGAPLLEFGSVYLQSQM